MIQIRNKDSLLEEISRCYGTEEKCNRFTENIEKALSAASKEKRKEQRPYEEGDGKEKKNGNTNMRTPGPKNTPGGMKSVGTRKRKEKRQP